MLKSIIIPKGEFFMKASESIPNYKSGLRMYANFAARTIKKVCAEIGPREAGTQAELDAQNYMAKQIGDAADEVRQEEFKVSHRAFLGWLRLAGILMLIVVVANIANIFVPEVFFAPIVSAVCCVLTAIMIFGEFLFYKPVIDPFFKKVTSHNTYCVRKASGETKRRIIIAGHSDSSIEWRFTHIGGAPLMYVAYVYPAVGLVYTVATTIYMLVTKDINPVLLAIDCAFIPGYIGLVIFMNYKICVDGANDNLTGCMTGAAVLKFMGDNDIRFENTEVIAMFSGAEEEGLRGAKASAKLHPEFKDPAVETVFIAFDTITDYDDMAIYHKDMSGLTKHCRKACALLKKGGENAGVDLPYALLFAGASDAAAMTQAGVHATTFAAMNPGPPKYYHTRDDKADILNLKTIEKGVEIALETVFLFDEQGLKTEY
ncbi:MAG: Zn-dependent exopeptidase M28 [Ruminococcaceae bacterium]|nr:Zn-dependent exopeptidase M28 [Oscillospiraceae bacterium]